MGRLAARRMIETEAEAEAVGAVTEMGAVAVGVEEAVEEAVEVEVRPLMIPAYLTRTVNNAHSDRP